VKRTSGITIDPAGTEPIHPELTEDIQVHESAFGKDEG
jgi:hypothetical protein